MNDLAGGDIRKATQVYGIVLWVKQVIVFYSSPRP